MYIKPTHFYQSYASLFWARPHPKWATPRPKWSTPTWAAPNPSELRLTLFIFLTLNKNVCVQEQPGPAGLREGTFHPPAGPGPHPILSGPSCSLPQVASTFSTLSITTVGALDIEPGSAFIESLGPEPLSRWVVIRIYTSGKFALKCLRKGQQNRL